VSDQLGAARSVAQNAAAPQRLRTTEVRALTFVASIERRLQLGGAGVNQIERSQLADDHATIAPQNIDNRGR
jgi:hypothetical protein